ncbi:phosphoribosylaminoimidazolesuccinocarboxamide synthase [Gudongella sp. DL1XJH-153]|uniref:phosphoribosylaminoimidazolesuccinocarboxamide synthase n=1 Tax=Gudongella sp. DL1XJH-153 TaxID=3409804 RepID=UPI003BB597C8
MKKLDMVYEGKAKKVFRTDDKDKFVVQYKDDATAGNGAKKGTIEDKGIVNNKMSAMLFEILEKEGVPNHFEELLSDREQLVKAVKIIPLEVIVRNVSAGSFSKRYGVEEGILFDNPVVEFSYKVDELGDPLINDSHILALKLATEEEIEHIKGMALRVNEVLSELFLKKNLKLIDFKLEFGKYHGETILADEISPDTCRLWDTETNEKLDKDRFRRDLGNIKEAYQEVMKRLEQ